MLSNSMFGTKFLHCRKHDRKKILIKWCIIYLSKFGKNNSIPNRFNFLAFQLYAFNFHNESENFSKTFALANGVIYKPLYNKKPIYTFFWLPCPIKKFPSPHKMHLININFENALDKILSYFFTKYIALKNR